MAEERAPMAPRKIEADGNVAIMSIETFNTSRLEELLGGSPVLFTVSRDIGTVLAANADGQSQELPENTTATQLCNRRVFGPALFLEGKHLGNISGLTDSRRRARVQRDIKIPTVPTPPEPE